LAAGDAALWSGIKRCGAAMHHGTMAACNIHQHILSQLTNGAHKPTYIELEEVPPMIGLAVGKKAVAYGPGMGTIAGEDVMEIYFKDDLGFSSKLVLSPFSKIFLVLLVFFSFFFFFFHFIISPTLVIYRHRYTTLLYYQWRNALICDTTTVCWKHMGLGGPKAVEETATL
jgi:hypothetical protein